MNSHCVVFSGCIAVYSEHTPSYDHMSNMLNTILIDRASTPQDQDDTIEYVAVGELGVYGKTFRDLDNARDFWNVQIQFSDSISCLKS